MILLNSATLKSSFLKYIKESLTRQGSKENNQKHLKEKNKACKV